LRAIGPVCDAIVAASSGTGSPCIDGLPPDSHVQYAVRNTAGTELARSGDVAVLTSQLTAVEKFAKLTLRMNQEDNLDAYR
jgi:hypothetical protein